jgi:hypothetical protein
LRAVLYQQRKVNQTRHMPSESMPMLINACESGSRIPGISIGHPQRKLNEVYYAVDIGIPNGRLPPPRLAICTRFTGGGK